MLWTRMFKFFTAKGGSRSTQCRATNPSTLSDDVWCPPKEEVDDVRAPKLMGPHTSFENLAKEQSFDELVYVLTDDHIDTADWLMHADGSSQSDGVDLCLHTHLKYQPPLPLISLLCNKLREMKHCRSLPETTPRNSPEAARDARGRTALHVACAHGCSIAVVARMMNGATAEFRNPAAVLDASRMLPLHWACNRAAGNDLENMQHVIGFLVDAYPEGVFMRDILGRSPSDLSLRHMLDPSIFRLLYRAIHIQRDIQLDKRPARLDQTRSVPTEINIVLGLDMEADDNDKASLSKSPGQKLSSVLCTSSDHSIGAYQSMVLEKSLSPQHKKDIRDGRCGILTRICLEERHEYSHNESHSLKGDQDLTSVEEELSYFGLNKEPTKSNDYEKQLALANGELVNDTIVNGVVDKTHSGSQHDSAESNGPQHSSVRTLSKWHSNWERRFRECQGVIGDDSSQRSQHTERTASETSKSSTGNHTLQHDANQGLKMYSNEGQSTAQVSLRYTTVTVAANDCHSLRRTDPDGRQGHNKKYVLV